MSFKGTAVKLSRTPGVQVKDVAAALDVHPFLLSRWRKEEREGKLRVEKGKAVTERVDPRSPAACNARFWPTDRGRVACLFPTITSSTTS